jgi:conjugative relaxase-like TrwC/TraI family protein
VDRSWGAALGLAGRVRGDQFSALLAGRDPRDLRSQLHRARGTIPRVAALDLTFSAPKSVSVLAAVGDDALTRELIVAHEEALRAALEYLEDSAVQVRRGAGGKHIERGDGLIAAAYRHRMSHGLDPQWPGFASPRRPSH